MKLIVGIVTYNPDIEILNNNIDAISNQVDEIYLVDNCSENVIEIEQLVNSKSNCSLEKLNKNFGIARALNVICEYSKKNNYDWVLTFDQDSICPNNLISEYLKYIHKDNVAMLSPVIYDRNTNFLSTSCKDDITEIKQCITSGTFFKLDVWEKIGKYDEYMFIDGVDFDICYRIIQYGYKIYRINSVILSHEIGKTVNKKILGFNFVVRNHSSFRKYYISRNNIYLYYKGEISLFIALMRNLKLLLLVIFYEVDKKNKIKMIFKGIYDGLKKV